MTQPAKRGWGQNVRRTPEDVKRAILKGVKEDAQKLGRHVPDDMEFVGTAEVVYLDDNNERVHFSRVVVTWDEVE
jgi:hypothetical protein